MKHCFSSLSNRNKDLALNLSIPEKNIIKTLVYYDIFSYPLTAEEIFQNLRINHASEVEVKKLILNGKRRDESLEGLLNLMDMIKGALKTSETDKDKIGLANDLKKLLLEEDD